MGEPRISLMAQMNSGTMRRACGGAGILIRVILAIRGKNLLPDS
jgi:hypothetical protein